eukprot:g42882.t1
MAPEAACDYWGLKDSTFPCSPSIADHSPSHSLRGSAAQPLFALQLHIPDMENLCACELGTERKVSDIEAKHRAELGSMRKEKELLQQLVGHQVNAIQELEKRLLTAISNNSGLQQQQLKLLDTVRHLITLITQGK